MSSSSPLGDYADYAALGEYALHKLYRADEDTPPDDGDKWRNPGAQKQRDFYTQLTISATVGLIAFLTFCIVRTRWTNLYCARKKRDPAAKDLPDLPKTMFGWIPVLYGITEDQILRSAGVDAVIFLGFFKMCARFLAVATVLAAAVLTPIHVKYEGMELLWGNSSIMAGGLHFKRDGVVQLPLMEGDGDGKKPKEPMLPTDAGYLWAYVAFVYIFTALCLYFLFNQTKRVIRIRQAVLGKRTGKAERTILLSGIPKFFRDEEKIKQYLEERNVGNVESVGICRNYLELDILLQEREKIMQKLESAYGKYHTSQAKLYAPAPRFPSNSISYENSSAPSPLPLHSGQTDDEEDSAQPLIMNRPRRKKSLFPWIARIKAFFARKNVNNINYLTIKLAKMDTMIREARNKKFEATPLAFVTFKTAVSAQIATQTLLDPKPRRFIAHLAPAPEDVIWSNTYLPRNERLFRTWTISVLVCFLTIVWLVPVGALGVFLNKTSIGKFIPGLSHYLEDHPLVASLIQTFLPTVILTALNVAVPYIYDYISGHQAYLSASSLNASVISKNFFFTFFNLFFAFSVFGAASNLYAFIRDSLKDTTKIAFALANALQLNAPFYVNLIVLQGLAMLPLRLLDFGSLFLYPYAYFTSPTPQKATFQQPVFAYQFNLPQPLLIFILCLAYSILTSGTTILFFGLVYFILSFFIYKHQLLYSHKAPYRSPSESMWSMIFYRVILGLLVFQSSMAGFLALRKAFTRAGLVGVSTLISIWAAWWYRITYERPGRNVALGSFVDAESAAAVDAATREEESRGVMSPVPVGPVEEDDGAEYVNPSLTGRLRGYEEFGVGDAVPEFSGGSGGSELSV